VGVPTPVDNMKLLSHAGRYSPSLNHLYAFRVMPGARIVGRRRPAIARKQQHIGPRSGPLAET
jgi:hypothetical protein